MIKLEKFGHPYFFEELKQVEKVNLAQVMSGESGAQRVRAYSIPMAEGLTYHYAAKQVDE